MTGYEIEIDSDRDCFSKKYIGRWQENDAVLCRSLTDYIGRPQGAPSVNGPDIYDPPKWKTLDMIEPGRDSVPVVRVESLYGTP